jgi:hypothetical protein|tara:strand:- start:49 stop:402 length:354 start_codon:yes stop_codon:yes gene_type:complete
MAIPIVAWATIAGLSRLANAALKTPAGKKYGKLVAEYGLKKGKQLFNRYVSSNPKIKTEAQKKAKLLDADERSIGIFSKPVKTKDMGHSRFDKKLQSDPYPVKKQYGGPVRKAKYKD